MRSSSKITVVGLTIASVIMLSSLINPAEAQRGKQGPDQERQARHLTLLKDKLDLTDGQVDEIKIIMKEARLEAEAEREQYKGDREAARNAREARRLANETKIKSVLNDQQKLEFDKVKDEFHQGRGSKGRDGTRGKRDGSGHGNGCRGNR